MKHYKISGIVICVILVCALSFFWFFSNTEAGLEARAILPEEPDAAALEMKAVSQPLVVIKNNLSSPNNTVETKIDEELNQQAIIGRLHQLYADRIDNVMVQIQCIEKLIRYLKERYPDNWQDHVYDYLCMAFPEKASELFDNHLKMADFKQWVTDNYRLLVLVDPVERKNLLWGKRKQFFGDDAEIIWETELKAEELSQSLNQLNSRAEMPFNEKLNYYLISIEGIYDNQADTYKQSYRQKVMDQFLDLESVQADLRKMEADERKKELYRFRTAMGLDETAMNRWAELDDLRDSRWKNGRAYMQSRAEILSDLGGPDREYIQAPGKAVFLLCHGDIYRRTP